MDGAGDTNAFIFNGDDDDCGSPVCCKVWCLCGSGVARAADMQGDDAGGAIAASGDPNDWLVS